MIEIIRNPHNLWIKKEGRAPITTSALFWQVRRPGLRKKHLGAPWLTETKTVLDNIALIDVLVR